MNLFTVKIGSHYDHDGKEFKAGQTIKSNDDLCALFPGKFDLVRGAPVIANDEPDDEPSSVLGIDVTGSFEGAADAGFRVYAIDGRYNIADDDEPDEPLTKNPVTKKTVVKWIESRA